MSQPSSLSSSFRILFDAALEDYKDKTGNTLIDHPIAKQLETSESVDSITSILQEQAQVFREFRENDGKLMKALKSSVDVLCAPSISSALNEAIGLVVRRKAFIDLPCSSWLLQPFPPAMAIFAGFGILLAVCLNSSNYLCISLTFNSPRRSKKCMRAMTHWLTFSRHSRTSWPDSVFMPGSLPHRL
jgi:hypothetical protein